MLLVVILVIIGIAAMLWAMAVAGSDADDWAGRS